jgi:sulfur-oxidizing protein SoxX
MHEPTAQIKSASPARWLALGAALLANSAALAQSPMPGQTLAFDRSKGNCLTCHVIAGGDAPGNVGPPLADMKARYPDRKELTAIIVDETKRNPLTVMPPFGRNLILTNAEIESVIDFLYTK